jgi:anti-sigma-K factor RskA
MTGPSREDIERHLERLPREAWDPQPPPAPPWPGEEPRARRPRRGLFLRPVTAAAAAMALLALGVAAGLIAGGGDEDRVTTGSPVVVALEPVAGGGASGEARLQPRAGGTASVELAGLPPTGADDFYELWLLGDDDRLVSLGSVTVPRSGRTTVDVQIPVDPADFRFLDVSLEPADGDPSHSSDSVLRGPLS